MKKAYLVTFGIMTRVIAETEEEAQKLAIEKVSTNSEYICYENIDYTEEDNECPFEESEEGETALSEFEKVKKKW